MSTTEMAHRDTAMNRLLGLARKDWKHAWLFPLALACVAVALPWIGAHGLWAFWLALTGINALIVSGLNLTFGYGGEFAFGQVAMFAASAYGVAYADEHGVRSVLIGLLIGAAIGAVIGLISGIPGLRLGQWPMAMVSFFLVLIIPNVINIAPGVTGGSTGLAGLDPGTLFGKGLTLNQTYIVIMVVLIAWIAALRNYIFSRHGVALRVLKTSPMLTQSLGKSPYKMRMAIYVLGSVPAGLAGALFVYYFQFVSPSTFTFTFAIGIFAASILGGSGTLYGAIIGSAVLQGIPLVISGFSSASLLIYGVLLIFGGLVFRRGVSGLITWTLLGKRPAGGDSIIETTSMREALSRRAEPRASAEQWNLACQGQTLEIGDVRKAFGGVHALSGVSLRAQPGQITALVGANGSGKTTLLNIVSGFEHPDSGTIVIGGEHLEQKSEVYRATRLGRTFQTPWIPTGLSAAGVVASGRLASEHSSGLGAVLRSRRFRRIEAADTAATLAVLDLLELSPVASSEAVALPLGTRRMVEVGRALVRLPDVLLLDEPAAGLDEGERENLIRIMRQLRDAGATLLLVEHNMAVVEAVADTVYLLDLGQVVASGTFESVRSSAIGAEKYFVESYVQIEIETVEG
jgi:branched-chain amino acid transport system permease protein